MRHEIHYHCSTTCEECRKWRYRVAWWTVNIIGIAAFTAFAAWRLIQ